jgi:hypothetical protein
MENIASFLKTAVSIMLTLAIISAGLLLWGKAQAVVDLANAQAVVQEREISEQQYSAFDGQIVSGSQILTAYRRYESNAVFCLYIQKDYNNEFSLRAGGSGSCRKYDYSRGELTSGDDTNTISVNYIQNISDTRYYISPQSRFRATLVRDANKRISAILFVRN